jgi:S1-C subfamily serine protease
VETTGYSESVRPGVFAAVSLVSAVVGGIVVLLVASAGGWLDRDEPSSVVQISAGGGASTPAAARSAVAPLAGNSFDPAEIYAERADGVVTVYSHFGDGTASQGSAFVVSPQGHLLTNSHVITSAGEDESASDVQGADEVYVEFKDGERVSAEIVGWDVFDDVAVLKVDPEDHPLSPLPLGDSSQVVVGEAVAAIGSPFGEQSSLAVGVVSATRRAIEALTSGYKLVDAIQTDAPINRGNSGGPLLDARGRVIGINAQIRSTSGNAEGVGFAVPINSARRTLEQLVENGRVAYAFVGITTDSLTPALARELGYEAARGALISEVTGAPARAAGLRGGERTVEVNGRRVRTGGDVVVAIDGHSVATADDLVRIVTDTLRPGDRASFTIQRGEKRLRIPVTLGERPVDPQR